MGWSLPYLGTFGFRFLAFLHLFHHSSGRSTDRQNGLAGVASTSSEFLCGCDLSALGDQRKKEETDTSTLALLKNQILIFGDFWLGKIRKSEKNQNKNQLTNTSINLGVMGMSTLVHTVRTLSRNTYVSVRISRRISTSSYVENYSDFFSDFCPSSL